MKAASVLTLAIVLFTFPQFHAQELPPKPPELKVLEQWIGKWNSDVTSKPAVWDREGSQYKGNSTEEWKLNGRFLYTNVKAKGEQGRYEFIAVRTYDEKAKAFRSWSFWSKDKASGISESSGQWDENTKTMTDRAVDADRGTVADSKIRFIDKDNFEFTFLVKDKEGTVLLDRHGVVRRQKADEPNDDQAEQGTPNTPELKLLDRLVGTWDWEVKAKPAEWNPKGGRTTGTLTRKWTLNGRFLQESGGNSDNPNIAFWTYDTQKRAYRLFMFDAAGFKSEFTGQWDETTKKLTWETDLGNGITARGTNRFLDNDNDEWQMVATDNVGKVYFDYEGKNKRKK